VKPKSLDELPSNDGEACQVLTSVGGFDTATLISLEYNVEALAQYISMKASPITFYSLLLLDSCLMHDLSALLCLNFSLCLTSTMFVFLVQILRWIGNDGCDWLRC